METAICGFDTIKEAEKIQECHRERFRSARTLLFVR